MIALPLMILSYSEGKKFQELDDIPDEACLLVVPLSLRAQVEVELHRYLKHRSFNILLCDRGSERMPDYWHKTFHLSKLEPGHRIVLATATVSYPFVPSRLTH